MKITENQANTLIEEYVPNSEDKLKELKNYKVNDLGDDKGVARVEFFMDNSAAVYIHKEEINHFQVFPKSNSTVQVILKVEVDVCESCKKFIEV